MPVTLVTLFRSYNQFYRAECITVSGFLRQKQYVLFCAVPEIFSSSEIFVADRNEQDGEGREEDAGGLSCPNQLAQDLLGGDI